MGSRHGDPAGTSAWYEPTRTGIALAGALVVITAVVAAPQFALDPVIFTAVLLAGVGVGVVTALLSHYRSPSRSFLVLAVPLVFLTASWLRDTLGLAAPTLLVGLSAVVVAGTVTDRIIAAQ